jgi:hypothetical protein
MKLNYYLVLIFFIAITKDGLAQYNTQTTGGGSVLYNYTYPGDDQYHYGVKNNEWYARNIKTGKTFNITKNPQYAPTIKKLDALYPGARNINRPKVYDNVDIRYSYYYPGDNVYIYGVSNGEWFAKNIKNNKTFNISRNPKFRPTVNKLDELYPQAR